MHLKVADVEKIMNSFAPKELKENYDNVGLMVGSLNSDVNNILFSLDCTISVIDEAIAKSCNLIFAHHPLLFKKPENITEETLLGRKIIKLIKNDINVYSSHTNLDSTAGGLNDILVHLLGYESYCIIEPSNSNANSFGNMGIGRMVEISEGILFSKLINNVKNVLKADSIRYSGDENKVIHKLAVINGSGTDYFSKAALLGADCILTGDTTYHYVSDFNELEIGIIDAGHFNTEWPGLIKFSNIFEEKIRNKGFDNKVIISSFSKNPYKTI